jgi:hypothetical protein
VRHEDGTDELAGHARWWRGRKKVEECIQAEEDKDEAQQYACDEDGDLHKVSN